MIIKVHRKETLYQNPHFFVLNKGYNSGKPQKTPFANSFVLIFNNEKDCENHFNVEISLWNSKFWHRFLLGRPIVFLRLEFFKTEFRIEAEKIMHEFEEHIKMVEVVRLERLREEQYHKNLSLIKQTKMENRHWYAKKQ